MFPEAAEPVTSIGAKFSIPFVVAVAIVKRKVAISHFLIENLHDPDVIRVAKKIRFKVDSTIGSFIPVEIEIRTTKQNYYFKVDSNNVHTNSNLSIEQLISKFRDCASYSKKQLPATKLDDLIDSLLHLEKVNDMREITDILV
ncbi:MAG: hypothetical protein PHU23_06200 [Dehalococcoidales bacterium]|nr:hypothetical protein [Dehalococcoidales bacterium]